MHKYDDNLVAGDLPYPRGDRNLYPRPGARLAARTPLASGLGFTVPVLVVCAVLWFLLSGNRLV